MTTSTQYFNDLVVVCHLLAGAIQDEVTGLDPGVESLGGKTKDMLKLTDHLVRWIWFLLRYQRLR